MDRLDEFLAMDYSDLDREWEQNLADLERLLPLDCEPFPWEQELLEEVEDGL